MPIRSTELITSIFVLGAFSLVIYRFLMDEKEEEPAEGKEKDIKSYIGSVKEELIALRSKLDMKVKLHAHLNYEDSKEGCTVKRFYFIRHGEAEHNQAKTGICRQFVGVFIASILQHLR